MIEVLKQALEAFEDLEKNHRIVYITEMVDLRQAIAELESQEPVGEVNRYGLDSNGRKWHGIHWYDPNVDVPHGTKLYTHPPQRTETIQSLQCFHCQVTIETLNDKVMHLMSQRTWVGSGDLEDSNAYQTPPAQPTQPAKPIPCANHCEATAFEIVIKNLQGEIERLKASQREWVGLTDERREQLIQKCWREYIAGKEDGTTFGEWMSVATEAELKEKNNA